MGIRPWSEEGMGVGMGDLGWVCWGRQLALILWGVLLLLVRVLMRVFFLYSAWMCRLVSSNLFISKRRRGCAGTYVQPQPQQRQRFLPLPIVSHTLCHINVNQHQHSLCFFFLFQQKNSK